MWTKGVAAMIARIALLVLIAAAPATAQVKLDAATVRTLQWQIALEREGFSPGLIDGKPGAKTSLATMEYQRRASLAATGVLDEPTIQALGVGEREPVQLYTVRGEDAEQVSGTIPQDWNAKAKMPYLGYASVAEAVMERFHCSRGLLERLNPTMTLQLLKAGDVVSVPAIEKPKLVRGTKVQIHLGQKVIRVLDRDSKFLALFHCSIAKDEAKRPTGKATIGAVALNPIYTFDPAMWPEVKNVNQKLSIAPGPRNPVGVAWISLSLPGYGIHGTPTPEMIGKTGSHGCFRLTNWDAQRLATMVSEGMAVEFLK
jgi:peptidoglycan hydrolase-like protein with peptidoglycan-binding domain